MKQFFGALFLWTATVGGIAALAVSYVVDLHAYRQALPCEATVLEVFSTGAAEDRSYDARVEYEVGGEICFATVRGVGPKTEAGDRVTVRHHATRPYALPPKPSILRTLLYCAGILFVMTTWRRYESYNQ